jgi:hypothetical protein
MPAKGGEDLINNQTYHSSSDPQVNYERNW